MSPDLDKILESWNFPRVNINLKSEDCEVAETKIDGKKIEINSKNIINEVGEEHLETIVSQQVGKIALCPFDIKTRLIHEGISLQATGDKELSQSICTLFSDVIVNSYMAENGSKQKIVDLLKATVPQKSDAQKLYLRLYEKVLKLPEKTLVNNVNNDIENSASILNGLFKGNIYNHQHWKKVLKKFTEILVPYIQKMPNDGSGKGKAGQENIQEGFGSSPVEYDEKSQETQQALKEIAKEMEKGEFQQLVAGLEMGNETFADITFYRAKSEQYKVHLPKIIVKTGETFPVSPKTWNAEDDPTKLDVQYSLGRHGIIIPGITTYQWHYQEGEGFKLDSGKPDLLLVIDSSGSMTDPFRDLSLAVLSAMTAKKSALDQGAYVAAINFSEQHKTTKYTQDERQLDNTITTYYGGGTVLPSQAIIKLVESNKNKQHIIIITDACIHDFENALVTLEEAVQKAQGGGSLFLIGDQQRGVKKSFEDRGYNVHSINQEQKLLNLVLEDVKKVYEA